MNADLTAIIADELVKQGVSEDYADHLAEQIAARLVAADWIGECLWESR